MKKILFLAAAALLTSSAAMAQGCCKKGPKLKSYSFVEVQGGMEWTATDAKIDKLLSPIGALSVGHYFTPVIGARLHVSGLEAKGRFEQANIDYKWNFLTTDADLLVNLSSLFSCNFARPLNVIFVGGVGLVNSWKHDDMNAIVKQNPNMAPLAWDNQHHFSHNLRAGLRLETNVTKPIGLSVEIDANNMDDRFNGKTNDADDWMISGMIGLSYRFGHKYTKPRQVVRQIEEEIWVDVPDTIIVKEKHPVTYDDNLGNEIFYVICGSDPTATGAEQLQSVADFMSKHQEATVLIVGYADKGTGNPRINAKYAERRAARCKDILVNKYNCDVARIKTDSKGDTVQPFPENDKNRCVIISSEGVVRETRYEEVEKKQITTKKAKQTVTREIVEEEWPSCSR